MSVNGLAPWSASLKISLISFSPRSASLIFVNTSDGGILLSKSSLDRNLAISHFLFHPEWVEAGDGSGGVEVGGE